MQLGVFVDRPIDAREQALGLEPRQMLLEIERRAARRFMLCLSVADVIGLVEHTLFHFLFFMCSAMIGLATRKQSTPIGAPQ